MGFRGMILVPLAAALAMALSAPSTSDGAGLGEAPGAMGNLSEGKGAPAPRFIGTGLSGREVSVEGAVRERGHLILLFWGLSCSSCFREIASLEEMIRNLRNSSVPEVFAVNTDLLEAAPLEREMATRKLRIPFEVVPDPSGEITGSYVPGLIPWTVLIDRLGNVRLTLLGFREEDMERLKTLLVGSAGSRE